MQTFDKIKELIADAEADVAKVDKGQKAAAKRVRKFLQALIKAAKEARVEALATYRPPTA
jgi:hypothetical protein